MTPEQRMASAWNTLIEELRTVPQGQPDGTKTVAQIAAETGMSETTARRWAREQVRLGTLKAVKFRDRARVQAYIVVEKNT